jgi:hypothetical protein
MEIYLKTEEPKRILVFQCNCGTLPGPELKPVFYLK